MKYNKGYSQKNVKSYIAGVEKTLDQQQRCSCSTSVSTFADIHGRPICQDCRRPINTMPRTVTIPYWFYEQK